MIRAEIHRPNLGSLAYVWIKGTEYVCGNTHEAHKQIRRHGNYTFIDRVTHGQTSVERYIITKDADAC